MIGVELHRLLLALEEGLECGSSHGAEPLTDETVEEEVDGCVQKGQHVGDVRHNVHQPAVLDGCPVEVIEDHDDAGRPKGGENGGDSEQYGSGFACGVAPETKIALPPKLVHNDGIQDEEDGTGHQIHCEAVDPDQDMMQRGADVVFSPDVGPPVVGYAGQEAGDVNTDNDLAGTGWVRDRVVFERVTDSNIPVNS